MVLHGDKIDKFKEFCGVAEDSIALRYLRHCGYNLQAAIQHFYQTNGVLEENEEEEEGWNRDVLGLSASSNSISRNNHIEHNAPPNSQSVLRSITPNSRAVQRWRQFAFAFLTLPFNFFISTVYDVLKFFYELVVGERTPSIEDMRHDVGIFRQSVMEKFSRTSVEFFDGTFDEAYLAACDSDKIFAAFLFTPGARQYEDVVRQILEDDNFNTTVIDFDMVLWGVDPRSAAGRMAARQMKLTKFPSFVALSSRDESTLMRVETPSSAQDIWPLLRQCALEELELREEEEFKKRILRENRMLMYQQEMEYRESEERDRAIMAERRRQKQLQEEENYKKNKEEKERHDAMVYCQQALNELRREMSSNQEVNDYSGKDCIRVLVRYPCGETSKHNFSPDESSKNLFGVVFTESYCPDYFEAHYGFPRTKLNFYSERYHNILMKHRRSLGQQTLSYVEPKTFRQLGISSSLTLYISNIDS
ncbi:hypothetical protein DICVIV_13239 [Dictyocaulus viviparus]|uniref:UAS domain-containing protein n=1 Tax=Dictyocaulus viviparus TaxID=29172 RepID=A0A0D8X8A7_DICVI|nr:hypothetical protein DICVIV_13239 [Dictyocaulus viviparus]